MNTPGQDVLRAAIETLADAGLSPRIERDATLVVEHDGRTRRYDVEVKRGLRREIVGPLVTASRPSRAKRLLVTDYVTPPLAEELRRHGIEFIDAAGNAYLHDRGLLIFITGRRPEHRPVMEKTLRIFRPSGLKVVFALLSQPELVQSPQRQIASAAGVALGSVAIVMDGLREAGFVAEMTGSRRIVRRDRLIDQWTEAYARLLYPTQTLGRFSAPDPTWWKRAEIGKWDAQWGGETAAAMLDRYLVPQNAVVYADVLPKKMLIEHRMHSDPQGSVIVRRRFWHFKPSDVHPDTVPQLLIYADLVVSGDSRSLEAAKQIRDVYLT
ncbi:MAG TPA: type IV toxin-antitoxin system AbiEi family antitoxin [Thermoanaerobaculia bacterium]|nr:type IV toxin-antitoxin system AbiEi family antitoxin [Thermoanaerobaculia bacterium]